MEEILKSIAEAEAHAEEIKQAAETCATGLVTDALGKVAELQKQVEAECKAYREKEIAAAQRAADEQYRKTLTESREAAKKYADELIENTDSFVRTIIGRTCGGR